MFKGNIGGKKESESFPYFWEHVHLPNDSNEMKLFLPAFHSLMPPQRGRVIRRDHCLVFLAQVSRLMTNLVPFSLFDKQGIWETGSGTRARITCS